MSDYDKMSDDELGCLITTANYSSDEEAMEKAKQVDALLCRLSRLREALAEYGKHKENNCMKAYIGYEMKCTCGLDLILKGSP